MKMSQKCLDESVSSPECLLTSEPVIDPYSTDEENEKYQKLPKKSQRKDGHTLFEFNKVPLETLTTYLNLKFNPVTPTPPPTESMNVDLLLETLIYFFTNQTAITADKLIGYVLTSSTSLDIIEYLYRNKKYAANLKSDDFKRSIDIDQASNSMYQDNSDIDQAGSAVDWLCESFFDSLSRLHDVGHSVTTHSNIAKDCMFKFAALLQEDQTLGGFDVLEIPHPTQKSSPSDCPPVKLSVVSRPDVTVGKLRSLKSPTIPVQVFSPQCICTNDMKDTNNKRKTTSHTDDLLNDQFDAFMNIQTPVVCTSCQKRLVKSTLVQNVLQIVSAAANYTLGKGLYNTEKQKVYLGLLMCGEFVYVTKVILDEEICKRFMSDLWQVTEIYGNNVSDVISVEMLSLAFDLTSHNHRMALLFFLKYYLLEWNNVNSKPHKV